MGDPKVINCEKRGGELVCNFFDKRSGSIIVHSGVNEKGEAVIIKSYSTNKEGAEPDSMNKAERYTLNQVRLKRTEQGEF